MNYVMNTADLFLSRCRNVTILSPTDFAIIAEWEKQGIPLAVILKSINEMCDDLIEADNKPKSVGEFQSTVKRNFIQWLQTKAGCTTDLQAVFTIE